MLSTEILRVNTSYFSQPINLEMAIFHARLKPLGNTEVKVSHMCTSKQYIITLYCNIILRLLQISQSRLVMFLTQDSVKCQVNCKVRSA